MEGKNIKNHKTSTPHASILATIQLGPEYPISEKPSKLSEQFIPYPLSDPAHHDPFRRRTPNQTTHRRIDSIDV
ncbi:hypothetical protein SESBI_37071 [Sesbania bispinosa]|nr:hypothetical protein SESBI_37071 [Sesbania bispinosa]